MTGKTKPQDTEQKAATAPKRVELVNTNKRNGQIGQTARPLETDAAAWLAKGWARKTAGNAE
ncbi:hypothetical protein [Leisingera sp. ANG-Vp]|uniref:hypothetical protein n=1 Tax=Leisingera sp. ANG-Vp TaxID=1577896 RepID=UPI00126A6556|nr:hypothetical protein [Leisingera sp. ANG-Vp]